MNKSVWSIAIIGALASMMLVLGMWMMLASYEQHPSAMKTKLAEQIRSQYNLEKVSSEVRADALKTVLRVYYESKVDSKLDSTVQREEMDRIAQFAMINYKGPDKVFVDEITVTRTEVKGGGCFQRTYTAHHSIPNTLRNAPREPRVINPQER